MKRALRFFYDRIPGAASAYHFLWAWGGSAAHRDPSKDIFVIGITGTKGKTTTLQILNAILEAAGKRTALLSSLRVKIGDETRKNPTGNSMPGHDYIQKFLRRAVAAKCEYALVEVTSQGVAMHRHRFIHWDIGAWTNLSPEHIESHGSFENYRAAKLSFLEYVVRRGGAVFLNRDDKKTFPIYERALAAHAPVSFSKDDEHLAQYLDVRTVPAFLLAEFNIANIAAAVAIARRLGIEPAVIKRALAEFKTMPGRAEFIEAGPYRAVVDYAHTPDSLEAIYRAAKPKAPGARLICILGAAGGGRDVWKRPAMGAIAAKYCDEIILSDEDPYDEKPADIIEQIARGIREADPAKHFSIELDRREAIKKAVAFMRPGDVVIGTGKGSEEWIHGTHGSKTPWDERKVFEEVMKERLEARDKIA